MRMTIGATLGAWLGFVGAKIKQSDWNDASRSAAAHRSRNQATVGGAIIGAALGAAFRFRGHRCESLASEPVTRPPVAQARRPITLEEIERSGISGNVYELVYSLRRNWLNDRGVEALSEGPQPLDVGGQEIIVLGEPRLVTYLDNARLGMVSKLREVPVAGVLRIDYFDGPAATYRWGAGHSHGAIQIITVPDDAR